MVREPEDRLEVRKTMPAVPAHEEPETIRDSAVEAMQFMIASRAEHPLPVS